MGLGWRRSGGSGKRSVEDPSFGVNRWIGPVPGVRRRASELRKERRMPRPTGVPSRGAKPKGKTPAESRAEMVQVVLPNDANQLGNILGGTVMHLIDIAGAIAAHRHARSHVVTASVDSVDFTHPIRVGQVIVLRSQVTRAFRTSMEVEVKVYLEDYITGERRLTSSAFVTYVAVGEDLHPAPVPPLIARTAEEKRLYREALGRRRRRLALAARARRRALEEQG